MIVDVEQMRSNSSINWIVFSNINVKPYLFTNNKVKIKIKTITLIIIIKMNEENTN